MNTFITIKELYDEKKIDLALSVKTKDETLLKKIEEPHINRPGLALSGFTENFSYSRLQIFGNTEIRFLKELSPEGIYKRIDKLFHYDIPCIFIANGLSVPDQVIYLANEYNIAVFYSRLSTEELFQNLNRYLNVVFAPTTEIHGTLLDIFGIGVCITGKSGIGKSECALELVDRGHRLVVDDKVKVKRIDDYLLGTSTDDLRKHLMEIRGVGIIDIKAMFGIHSVRKRKKIEHIIDLRPWKEKFSYDRSGLKESFMEYLGIKVPLNYLMVTPGKNVSVIIEVIAMNHILKKDGYNSSVMNAEILRQQIKKNDRRTSNKFFIGGGFND